MPQVIGVTTLLSTPFLAKVNGCCAVATHVFLFTCSGKETIVAFVHTEEASLLISAGGARADETIAATPLLRALSNRSEVQKCANGCSGAVYMSHAELMHFIMTEEECVDVVTRVLGGSPIRRTFRNTPERAGVVQRKREADVMATLTLDDLTGSALFEDEKFECGNGHLYNVRARLEYSRQQGVSYITCGVPGCTQLAPTALVCSVISGPLTDEDMQSMFATH